MVALLAGDQPAPIRFGFMTWVQHGLLLISLLQVIGVATALRRLRRWLKIRAAARAVDASGDCISRSR